MTRSKSHFVHAVLFFTSAFAAFSLFSPKPAQPPAPVQAIEAEPAIVTAPPLAVRPEEPVSRLSQSAPLQPWNGPLVPVSIGSGETPVDVDLVYGKALRIASATPIVDVVPSTRNWFRVAEGFRTFDTVVTVAPENDPFSDNYSKDLPPIRTALRLADGRIVVVRIHLQPVRR